MSGPCRKVIGYQGETRIFPESTKNMRFMGDCSNDTGRFSGPRPTLCVGMPSATLGVVFLPPGTFRLLAFSVGAAERPDSAFPRRAWEREAPLRSVAGIHATVSFMCSRRGSVRGAAGRIDRAGSAHERIPQFGSAGCSLGQLEGQQQPGRAHTNFVGVSRAVPRVDVTMELVGQEVKDGGFGNAHVAQEFDLYVASGPAGHVLQKVGHLGPELVIIDAAVLIAKVVDLLAGLAATRVQDLADLIMKRCSFLVDASQRLGIDLAAGLGFQVAKLIEAGLLFGRLGPELIVKLFLRGRRFLEGSTASASTRSVREILPFVGTR